MIPAVPSAFLLTARETQQATATCEFVPMPRPPDPLTASSFRPLPAPRGQVPVGDPDSTGEPLSILFYGQSIGRGAIMGPSTLASVTCSATGIRAATIAIAVSLEEGV